MRDALQPSLSLSNLVQLLNFSNSHQLQALPATRPSEAPAIFVTGLLAGGARECPLLLHSFAVNKTEYLATPQRTPQIEGTLQSMSGDCVTFVWSSAVRAPT